MTAERTATARRLRQQSRLRMRDGRLVVVAILAAYLGSVAIGGRAQWLRLHVPAETPTFVDMRSITTSWECERRGIDPLPRNPCDPWAVSRHNPRPANRPRLWLLPGRLGLGESLTVPLALANAFLFFAAILCFVGLLGLWEGLVVALALCSPAVMLGVERGNVDLVSLASLTAGLLLLRRRKAASRLVAHGLFLLAAAMKIFPSFAFVVLARQRRPWVRAGAAVVGLFALYIALTWDDLSTIRRVYPQEVRLSYGSGVFADSIITWLKIHGVWPLGQETDLGAVLSKIIVAAGLATAIPLGLRWRLRFVQASHTPRFDGFVAGAAIYVATYVLLHEYDYRLASLVLVVPQLLSWSRTAGSLWARLGLANVLLVLLLAARSPGWPPYEEVFNWLLFVYFAAALLALAAARLPAQLAALRPAIRAGTASHDEASKSRPAGP